MIRNLDTTNPHLWPGNSVITYNQGYTITSVMDSGVFRYCFPRVIGGYSHCSHLLEFTEERTKGRPITPDLLTVFWSTCKCIHLSSGTLSNQGLMAIQQTQHHTQSKDRGPLACHCTITWHQLITNLYRRLFNRIAWNLGYTFSYGCSTEEHKGDTSSS